MSFIEVYAHRNPQSLSLELYLRAGKGTFCTIDERGELLTHEVQEGALMQPSLRLPYEAGDKLIDELIRAGFRPTKTTPPDETIAAQRAHILFAEEVATKTLTLLGDKANDRQQKRTGRVGERDRNAPKGVK